MKPLLAALAVALCGAGAAAEAPPAADRLESPSCRQARAELERLLGQPGARRDARLDEARRRASDACLGRASGTPQRSGAPEPPQSARPITSAPPPAPQVAAPPAPPVAIPRPTVITTCDAAGCWDSAGRRLNQQGPFLVGPGGPCNSQAGLVSCP